MTDPHLLGVVIIALSVLNLIVQLWLYRSRYRIGTGDRGRRRVRYLNAAVEPGVVSEARVYAHLTRGLYPEKARQIAIEVRAVEVPITITIQ